MSEYEVELGTVTERRNVRMEELFRVTVDVYVQEASTDDSVGDVNSADHEITFDIADGRATLRRVDADPEFTDLALVAIRAAAEEVDRLQDGYEVVDPIEAVREREYTLLDASAA
jgi:hypothetical protein